MNHFDLPAWTDYVRGIHRPNDAQMAHHLRECASCARIVDLLLRVVECSNSDRQFDPPPQVLAAAEQIFSGSVPLSEQLWEGLRLVVGQFMWNSGAQAVPAGVRNLHPDPRHLIYRAGRYSVDLLLDVDAGTGATVLTGQLAQQSPSASPLHNTKAVLLCGRKIIATAITNEFGEFSLRYDSSYEVRLCLPVEEAGEFIELSLDFSKVTKQ